MGGRGVGREWVLGDGSVDSSVSPQDKVADLGGRRGEERVCPVETQAWTNMLVLEVY